MLCPYYNLNTLKKRFITNETIKTFWVAWINIIIYRINDDAFVLGLVAASNEGTAMMHSQLPLIPGTSFFKNIKSVLTEGLAVTGGEPITSMLINSLFMAFIIAVGKIILALGSAFALVYFDFPFKKSCFALIFATMMLPVEVRIVPTFQVVASFGLLNSFSGLTLPLLASATGTFLFRQFFKTISKELVDAAKLDGAYH